MNEAETKAVRINFALAASELKKTLFIQAFVGKL